MSRYKAYSEYRDSGVEWLGLIPREWQLKSMKYMAKIKNGQDYKTVEVDEGYPVIGSGGQFTYASSYTYAKESVLLGRKGTIDKPLYINEPFWTVDTMYYTEINKDIYPKFLYYLALTIQFSRYSTNTALPSMTQEHLGSYRFAVPVSADERKAIANFLDHETAKIDTLIAKQQGLIKLLKERRQAMISHAVTKGLNPNAPMRDSGVEWLGEVPAHWVVEKIRYLGDCQNGINIGADFFGSGYPFVSYGDTYRNEILPTEVTGLVESTAQDRKTYSVELGDVIFTRTSETINEIGFSSTCLNTIENASFAGFLIRFRPIKSVLDPNFSKYYFRNVLLRAFFVKEMNLVTRASLSQDLLKKLPVTLPSLVEQKEIADFLDTKALVFAKLIKNAELAIELMKERRTALISATVTGKIDVRGWKPAPVSEFEDAAAEPAYA
ncbi:restriction endonuclease subunit S [Collimonas pratensis]|uniref:restriction endonuclease subunit S n=1 Tax=Collimonas pratensis TaxID=279113 RepID=UPI00143D24C8|nr:restriction endonuclease subunit S [Collimonas pratensis]NKI70828.1 restriction endonuclease subunit S [Collimonas pratensis]